MAHELDPFFAEEARVVFAEIGEDKGLRGHAVGEFGSDPGERVDLRFEPGQKIVRRAGQGLHEQGARARHRACPVKLDTQ